MLGLGNNLMTPSVSGGFPKRGSLVLDGVGDYITVGSMNDTMDDTFTITWRQMFDDSNISSHQISGQQNSGAATDMSYMGWVSTASHYGWHRSDGYLNSTVGGAMWTKSGGVPTSWVTIGMSFDCTGGGTNATGIFFCESSTHTNFVSYSTMPIANVNAFESDNVFGIGVWIKGNGGPQWVSSAGAIADVAIYKGYAFDRDDFEELYDSPEKDYRTLSHAAYLTTYLPFGEAGTVDVMGGITPVYAGDPVVSMTHPSD